MRISVDGSRIRNNKVAFSNFSGIVWTGPQLQRWRMLCESTFGQVEPKCIPAWQKVFAGRRVTLPSKASGLARRVALLVPAEPT